MSLGGRFFQRGKPLGAGIDQSEVGCVFRRQRVEAVDRRIVFPACGAQREQPLLDALQFLRVVIGGSERLFEMPPRLFQRVERRVERLHRGLQQPRRLRGAALQPAHRRRQGRHRRRAAGHSLVGLAQIARDLLALHHLGAAIRQRGFLASPGRQLGELLNRVTQPVGFARRALDIGAMAGDRGFGLAAGIPQPLDGGGIGLQARIGIEQAAMGRRIDQRAGVVLAVDFHQRRTEILQRLHADRLIVDEGAGAAVGKLHAAQDQCLAGLDVAFDEQRAGRMIGGQLEHRGDLALLGALAHQRRIASRTERQRERIEQDRLAGAGLAGQHRQAAGEIDVEPIDQDNVADREPGQHDRTILVAPASAAGLQCFQIRHHQRHEWPGQAQPGE